MSNDLTTRELTCIVCPRGCALRVTLRGKEVVEVQGNACKRGAAYAENECTHPVRTLTTTVGCADGSVVAVKTTAPIPKELLFEAMKAVNSATAPMDAEIGQIIMRDLLGTGADLVVTGKRSR